MRFMAVITTVGQNIIEFPVLQLAVYHPKWYAIGKIICLTQVNVWVL